jgi:hypothetical protein
MTDFEVSDGTDFVTDEGDELLLELDGVGWTALFDGDETNRDLAFYGIVYTNCQSLGYLGMFH